MPKLTELTAEERDFFCDTLYRALSEENTDRLLELVEARIDELEDRYLPWWGKAVRWVPGIPDPSDMVRKRLDALLPELIRDPLIDLVGCADEAEKPKAA